jgi:hypothetical protein
MSSDNSQISLTNHENYFLSGPKNYSGYSLINVLRKICDELE